MFVYVMDKDSKETLEKQGFKLIEQDERNGVWVFENKAMNVAEFELSCPCVVSDILTF